MKVSHDFAVNFDEDNPECAGEIANAPDSFTHRQFHVHTSWDQNNSPVSVQHVSHLFLAVSQAFLPLYLSPPFFFLQQIQTFTRMHMLLNTTDRAGRFVTVLQEAFQTQRNREKQHLSVCVKWASVLLSSRIGCEGFCVCVVYVNEKCLVTLDRHHRHRV